MGTEQVFGIAPEWLLHDDRVIATSLVLSHPEQLDRLRRSCPEAAGVAVVAGDPSFDRMLASVPLRHQYREAFGAGPTQKLIFVSSTWGPASLFGRQPDLVRRLRAELPLDEYVVAVALHPNTWSAHSPWQIRRWLHACTRAGVIVVPAHEGWRAGLVSADLVLGDHGSVTFYGASLGRPVVLAEAPQETVDPESAIGRFLAVAPRIDRSRPLRPQIDTALKLGQPDEVKAVAGLTTSLPLKSHAALRTEFYRLLRLEEPEIPAEATILPTPPVSAGNAAVQSVHVTLRHEGDLLHATVVRHAAELVLHGRPLGKDAHLVVHTDEVSGTALQLGDVIVHDQEGDADWITRTLTALPGATVATRPLDGTRWLAGTRDGHRTSFGHALGPVLASVALAWTVEGHPLCSLPRVNLSIGGTERRVEATTTHCVCSG